MKILEALNNLKKYADVKIMEDGTILINLQNDKGENIGRAVVDLKDKELAKKIYHLISLFFA